MKSQLLVAALAVLAMTGCGPDETPPSVPPAEQAGGRAMDGSAIESDGPDARESEAQEFVRKAGLSNLMEIKTSEIAQTKAQRPDVQALATMLVTDHTQAGEKLKQVVGGQFPVPGALDRAEQDKVDDMNDAEPASFDRDYLDLQEEAHEKAVALFRDYAQTGEHPGLKGFAAETLPTLEHHLEEVRKTREGFDMGDDALGAGSGEADDPATPGP